MNGYFTLRLDSLLLCSFLSLTFTTALNADVTGSILGTATDSTSAVLHGVEIVATNLETNLSQTTRTDSLGQYRILALPVGKYKVEASLAGFQKFLETGIDTRTRLTTDPGDPENVVFSPDGARAVFVSVRGADVGFYEKPSSGAGAEQTLLSSGAGTALTEWTRDGRFLLFAKGARQTQFDLWVLPMEGEHKPFPFLRTQFHEIGARLSPDGRWIAYYSNESGKTEIYVKRFIAEPDGGASAAAGKWLISHAGGVGMIHWRNDGKELYYLAPDGKIMVVEVGATGSDFRSGVPKALFSIPQAFVRRSTTPGSLADITPDGKRFLFALPVEQNQSNDFKVVLNWEAGLKR